MHEHQQPSIGKSRSRKVPTSVFTVVVVSTLVLLKLFAYAQSDSVSILTSLTDSLLDVVVSLMALGSIVYSQRPADEDHRWGHGKMEAVYALIQVAVIIGGSTFLVFESINRIFKPKPILDHNIAITVMCVSIVLSIVLVIWQRQTLKHEESLTIEAETLHYGSDILVNIGTVIVLFASLYGAPIWIDSLFAIGVALFMATMARTVFIKSLNMLLDRELPEQDRDAIIETLESHTGVLGWHDLRTRRHGDVYDISFDIEVNRKLSLIDAHEITKELESELVRMFSKCDVMIHVDPQGFTEDERHRVKGIHI